MPDPTISSYPLGSGYSLERAEPSLFSVYQALYSNSDTEMWYDWKMRLNDTLWSKNGFFLIKDGQKLAGAIIEKGHQILYPFIIPPFADKALFYRLLHKTACAWNGRDSNRGRDGNRERDSNQGRDSNREEVTEIIAHDVMDEDVDILLTMGYARARPGRRVMIRPTDCFADALPEGFRSAVPAMDQAAEITAMLNRCYENGLHAAAFGPISEEETAGCIERAGVTGTLDVSALVYEARTGELAGACLAGVSPNAVNGFAGISEVGVLPGYQNRGLGAWLVKNALSKALRYAPAMKLVVTDGNPAESLYRRLGFLPGPRFTRMIYQ